MMKLRLGLITNLAAVAFLLAMAANPSLSDDESQSCVYRIVEVPKFPKTPSIRTNVDPGAQAAESAVYRGDRGALAALFATGVNPNTTNFLGETLLMLAVTLESFSTNPLVHGADAFEPPTTSSETMTEFLLFKHADVDSTDMRKSTALMKACEIQGWQIARILLDYGANAQLRDKYGYTALDHAIMSASNSERSKRDDAIGTLVILDLWMSDLQAVL